MPVELQTAGQRSQLAYAEVSLGTGVSAPSESQAPRMQELSPEARAAFERLTGRSTRPLPASVELPSPQAERSASAVTREIADNLTIPARSLDDPNETRLARGVFVVDSVALEVPMVAATDASGTRRAVRLEIRNALMPDGSEVARGSGRATLLIENGLVTGMLEGALQYDASTTYIKRAGDGPLAGHRGEPGSVVSGAAVVRDGRVVGLSANSVIDIDGVRIRSGADDAAYRFTPPDLYALGPGATILSVPADRAIRVSGADVAVVRGNVTTRLADGATARVAPGGASIAVEGASETWRELPAPPPTPSHVGEFERGNIVLRRIPGAQLYIDGIKSSAFDQIGAGDCYLVAALLAAADMQPEMIRRLITDNRDGTFTVHFMGNDGPVDITVDDRFYMAARSGERVWYHEKEGDIARYASSLTSMAYGANPAQPREIWGAIIEKAYAQWKGGYGAIYSGYPDIAMREITGRLSGTTRHADTNADAVFADLQRALARRQPTVAITQQPATPETQQAVDAAFRRDYGMRNNHVYVVIDTVTENGVRYVVLRNTERLIEGRSSEYATDVDRDGDGKPDGADGYFRLRHDDYFRRFVMTTTMDPERRFVPGTRQVPYAEHPRTPR